MNRRTILSFALLAGLAPGAALAQTKPVRIGVMNDMSSVYSDFQGPGSVLAAQMAVEDFNKTSSRKAEVIFADHQNKADVG
ncbi:MAG: ABC transporter substrate-binding protein, partial [Microvirga sp.]